MLSLPHPFLSVIAIFAPVFSKAVWPHVHVLLTGAVFAPGKRTVTAILQIMGRSTHVHFQTYHRVLNRAVWSPLQASRLLLRVLVAVFIPYGVIVLGLDDTIRVWALPFLTVLCPSEQFYQQHGRRHQSLTECAWQSMQLVKRWLPRRDPVFVADSSFAALELIDQVQRLPTTSLITRLRLDAALYDPAPPREPTTKGRPRLKGKRRPTLEAVLADDNTEWTTLEVDQWYGEGPRKVDVTTNRVVWYHAGKLPVAIRWVLIRDPKQRFRPQALLSTDLEHTPQQILTWFVRRWTMEVTFEEARAHLGMETQRQWHDRAIARSTPALLSLFSIITLTAHLLIEKGTRSVRRTTWYAKSLPTFSDAMPLVRRHV